MMGLILANIKFSKTELSKMIQSGGIIGKLIHGVGETLLRAGVEGIKRRVKKS